MARTTSRGIGAPIAGRVRADQRVLQLGPALRGDERVGQRAEPGGDAVDRAAVAPRCRPRWPGWWPSPSTAAGASSTRASPRATASTSAAVMPVGWTVTVDHVRHSVVQDLAGPVGHPAGRPGAGRTGRRGSPGRPARRGRSTPDVVRRSARAPPAVAAQTASAGVIRISRTASATQNGIDEVYDDPGLQSVASATVTPASSSRRASGYGDRVENSAPGSRVATVSLRRLGAAAESQRRRRRRTGGCSGRRWPRPARPRAAPPAPGRAGWRAAAGRSPADCPAVRMARGVVGVEGAPLAEDVDPAGVRRGGGRASARRPAPRSRRAGPRTRRGRRARRGRWSRR